MAAGNLGQRRVFDSASSGDGGIAATVRPQAGKEVREFHAHITIHLRANCKGES